MKYLITGAGGFLGSTLVKYLKDTGEDVYAAKRRTDGEAVKLDITKAEQFDALDFYPDIIINCASALPDPTQSFNDPVYLKRLFDTNVIGGANLMNWAVSKKVKRIINCSTLVVVGKPWPMPLKEVARTYPKGPHVGYSASKLSQELVMSSIAEANEIDLMHVRISALYGPEMKEGGILTKLINQAAAKENITLMNGNQVSFGFLHVDDAVKILHHISKLSSWPDNIINLASGEEISLLKLTEIICKLYENPKEHIQNVDNQDVLSRSKVDIKLLKKYLKGSGISTGPFSEKSKKYGIRLKGFMRVLIFGDVHGNLVALERMLQQASSDVDLLVCHGDVVNYGPWSNECVQLLQDINCTCLIGNHESYFLEGSYPGENKVAKTFFNHCYPTFQQQELISNYNESTLIGDFQVQHTIDNQYIFPDTEFNKLELKENYIIGHSHHQFSALTTLGKRLINTGSVGQNRKFINVINYIIYDINKADIQLKTLIYDIDLVIKEMRNRGYPQICLDYYLQKEKL